MPYFIARVHSSPTELLACVGFNGKINQLPYTKQQFVFLFLFTVLDSTAERGSLQQRFHFQNHFLIFPFFIVFISAEFVLYLDLPATRPTFFRGTNTFARAIVLFQYATPLHSLKLLLTPTFLASEKFESNKIKFL